MFTYALLYAGLLPLVASASVAFIMRRLRSPIPIAWPVAITGGFLTAQFTLRGQAGFSESVHTFFQPHEAVDWLPHIVLLALGVSIVMYLAPPPPPAVDRLGRRALPCRADSTAQWKRGTTLVGPGKGSRTVFAGRHARISLASAGVERSKANQSFFGGTSDSRRGGHRHRTDAIRRTHVRPLIRRPRQPQSPERPWQAWVPLAPPVLCSDLPLRPSTPLPASSPLLSAASSSSATSTPS